MCISLGYNVFVLLIKTLKFLFGWLVFKTAKEGAQTTIHLAVSEDVKGITGITMSHDVIIIKMLRAV